MRDYQDTYKTKKACSKDYSKLKDQEDMKHLVALI